MTQFDAARRSKLVLQIVEVLCESWPTQYYEFGPSLNDFVSESVSVAIADGFSRKDDLTHYANIVFAVVVDLNLGANPHDVVWVRLTRADVSQPPEARVARMYVYLYNIYDQVEAKFKR